SQIFWRRWDYYPTCTMAILKNQYFISTHNPYLLLSILEKAHKDEVAIFITYFEDYQTKVKLLNEKDLEEIMELGIDPKSVSN
ncbi:MAG: hypothetical protein ACXQTR_01605, partial [Candidatus Methanospirareceae archaeon]